MDEIAARIFTGATGRLDCWLNSCIYSAFAVLEAGILAKIGFQAGKQCVFGNKGKARTSSAANHGLKLNICLKKLQSRDKKVLLRKKGASQG